MTDLEHFQNRLDAFIRMGMLHNGFVPSGLRCCVMASPDGKSLIVLTSGNGDVVETTDCKVTSVEYTGNA